MGVVDKGAVGTHLLDDIPQRLHDAVVDECLGVVDEHHGIGHGIEHRAQIVEHCLLAVAQPKHAVLVVMPLGSEHEFAVLTQHFVFGEHRLPLSHHLVEACLGKVYLLAHELMGLVVHQFAELVNEHDIGELVKLCVGRVLDLVRCLVDVVEHRVN